VSTVKNRYLAYAIIITLCDNSLMTFMPFQGITRLLFVQIPFYREVIISSFECPHCFYANREIQSAGMIQEKGVMFNLRITNAKV